MRRFAATLALILIGQALLPQLVQAQTKQEATTRYLIRLLEEPIETRWFTTPMTFKDAAGLLYEQFAAKGKELPIVVDRAAFRDGDPSTAFDPYETAVSLQPVPRQVSAGDALRTMLSLMAQRTTFLIREGQVVVVPESHARAEHLLQRTVRATFDDVPLQDALQELAGMTGMSIILDTRQEGAAKRRVSATFRNDITLRDAITTLVDMNELRADFMTSGVYVTAPKASKGP
jgi:hypothetical protein